MDGHTKSTVCVKSHSLGSSTMPTTLKSETYKTAALIFPNFDKESLPNLKKKNVNVVNMCMRDAKINFLDLSIFFIF